MSVKSDDDISAVGGNVLAKVAAANTACNLLTFHSSLVLAVTSISVCLPKDQFLSH